MSGWRAIGIDIGSPPTLPAEVIGSWASSQPSARVIEDIRTKHRQRVHHVHEQETAVGEVDFFGQDELFGGLGDRHDLGFSSLSGCLGNLVAAGRVDVDGVDPAAMADDRSEGDGHVAATSAYVGATPASRQPEPFQCSLQGAAVDVVAEVELRHLWRNPSQAWPVDRP